MARKSRGDAIFIATESFQCEIDGEPVDVRKDVTRVREGHPLLEGREQHFKPLDVHFDVEQATVEPGEKRGTRAKAEG